MNPRPSCCVLVLALVLAVCAPAAGVSGQTDVFAETGRNVSPASQTLTVPLTGVQAIAAGRYHSCALITGGGIKCWGQNVAGQLGDGTKSTYRHMPVDVHGLDSGMQAIAGGYYHTCALTTGGGVKCWGYNSYGQLGDSSTSGSDTPVDVAGLGEGVQAIAAGGHHSCALNSGGGVQCWGWNGYGQLGDSSTTDRPTPVDVHGLDSGVAAIAAGGSHTCALSDDGDVQCWGVNSDTPVDVAGLDSGVQAITVGEEHNCALTPAGVKCWGRNSSGQLGDNSTTYRHAPVDVHDLGSSVQAVAAGASHTCALTTSGGVQCWGDNEEGQLGDGNKPTNSATAVDVVGLSKGVRAIAAGGFHTCALTDSGGVKCWGKNEDGQLGDGNAPTDSDTPVDVVYAKQRESLYLPALRG